MKYTLLAFALVIALACGEKPHTQQAEAVRMLASARDLEEELDDLPRAIDRYGEISEKFAGTEVAQTARERQTTLTRVQTLLADVDSVEQDSLMAFYESVVQVAPDYLAVLKKLSTQYFNHTKLAAPGAAKTGIGPMKDHVVEVWEKQDKLWSHYNFRPIPSDRLWQDRIAKQAIMITEMLIDGHFREYERAHKVIHRGLDYASSVDVKSRAKVFAAYSTFWKGNSADFEHAIALAKEALDYDFLADNDQARAYHVIGLCYTYMFKDSKEVAHLNEAIKALNEAVNIDGQMAEAKELLKTLRQHRERLSMRPS